MIKQSRQFDIGFQGRRRFCQTATQSWTLSELCAKAGVSKSVLSEKLIALIGHSPIEYLTLWRLQIAAHWLMAPNMTLERVAERSG
ncbi:helix-turn-helix domain-containing protein [Methylomonas rosea]|uniref:HTH araC/xylS-type domain-containing protein n=1 Tax=Methylomonas rosea TaxID=2952227 RepID=A0ABT1TTB0_9GAMM|nr:helix-turn-helix domain-containing protein [Methylomonas sp. WSC-7]MCQ8118016.1 hypothetical protein [Methylomonas sp. WSC-7]